MRHKDITITFAFFGVFALGVIYSRYIPSTIAEMVRTILAVITILLIPLNYWIRSYRDFWSKFGVTYGEENR